jgi:hypothetical protein
MKCAEVIDYDAKMLRQWPCRMTNEILSIIMNVYVRCS